MTDHKFKKYVSSLKLPDPGGGGGGGGTPPAEKDCGGGGGGLNDVGELKVMSRQKFGTF